MSAQRRRGPRIVLSLALTGLMVVTASCSTGELSSDQLPAPTQPPAATVDTGPLPEVSPAIEALADRTTMTERARRVFYRTDPRLVDKAGLAEL
jgi:hypothetical protein